MSDTNTQTDPYQSVINHYGDMRHAYWMEIGLGQDVGSWLRDNFNTASFDLGDASPKGYNNRVISFELINKTGNIPQVSNWGDVKRPLYAGESEEYWGSQRIDWDANDTFTNTYQNLFENIQERIEISETLLDLRAQESWNYNDRVNWEREISEIINEEMDKVPGLGDYRHTFLEGLYNPIEAEIRPAFVNELSTDIENETTTIEFDCETMSAIEGSLLQRIDEQYLPVRGEHEDDYKIAFNYYYVNGEANFGYDSEVVGHAFIISSATGNIIEATNDPDLFQKAYIESENPDFSFEDFVRGDTFVGQNDYAYGGHIEPFITQRDAEQPQEAQPLPTLPPLSPTNF